MHTSGWISKLPVETGCNQHIRFPQKKATSTIWKARFALGKRLSQRLASCLDGLGFAEVICSAAINVPW